MSLWLCFCIFLPQIKNNIKAFLAAILVAEQDMCTDTPQPRQRLSFLTAEDKNQKQIYRTLQKVLSTLMSDFVIVMQSLQHCIVYYIKNQLSMQENS